MTYQERDGKSELLFTWTSFSGGASRRIRGVVRLVLTELGVSSETIDDAVLAIHELAANATEHAVGPYELRVQRGERRVVWEVLDHDPRIPEVVFESMETPFLPKPQDKGAGLDALCTVLSQRGRGLQIVNHLFKQRWGFRASDGEKKNAWIAIPLETSEPS